MEQWIAEACRLIRYGPDRETVSQELRNHMEDVYDGFLRNGANEEEATANTL